MSSVIKRAPNPRGVYEYKESVHTPNFDSGIWLINPDLSSVGGVEKKYWKVVAETVVEMSVSEKEAIRSTEHGNEADKTVTNFAKRWLFEDHFGGQYLDNVWLLDKVGAQSDIIKKPNGPCAQNLIAGNNPGDYQTLINSYQTIDRSQKPLVKVGLRLAHTTNVAFYFGLWDSSDDRIEFKADGATGFWEARTYSGGSDTTTVVNALDTQWHHLKILVKPQRVIFKIDNVKVASHNLNITGNEMYFRAQIVTTAGAVNRRASLDYVQLAGDVSY